jgi:tetratricopeptide (TPR) repeat protein
MEPFDKLWNYNDPAATEIKFRDLLQDYTPENDLSLYLQLQTQIARTYSLRQMFNEAHSLLNLVQGLLPSLPGVEHIRYHLERGRTFNSAGSKVEAKTKFEQALQYAADQGEDAYAIDALHMLAITAPPDEAISRNEEAIRYAEKSDDIQAKNWLGSLYNNLAWAYFVKGLYQQALDIFTRALRWRESKKSQPEIFIAKWSIGRTLRALDDIEEAMAVQHELYVEMQHLGKPDGYVYEELAELLLIANDPESKRLFGLAYKTLSKDAWFSKNEAARLERLKQLAGNIAGG